MAHVILSMLGFDLSVSHKLSMIILYQNVDVSNSPSFMFSGMVLFHSEMAKAICTREQLCRISYSTGKPF